jgi:hypothetical protein
MTKTIDSDQLTKLIRDPIIVRIVSIVDIASLSILELLEYNLTRKDTNYALLNGVIAVDKLQHHPLHTKIHSIFRT